MNCVDYSCSEKPTCDANVVTFHGSALQWPETDVLTTAVLPCPFTNTNYNATRFCGGDGVWQQPNTVDCALPTSMC